MDSVYESARRAIVDALIPEIKQMQTQLSVLTVRMDAMGARLDRVDARLDRVDARLDRVEDRLGNVEKLLAALDAKLDTALDFSERLAAQETRIALLESHGR